MHKNYTATAAGASRFATTTPFVDFYERKRVSEKRIYPTRLKTEASWLISGKDEEQHCGINAI